MKKHLVVLNALMLLSPLPVVHAATMEDKPMATEMKQTPAGTGSESMTKHEATGTTMKPAAKKGMAMGTQENAQKMQGTKEQMQHGAMKDAATMAPAAPMMETGKAAGTMETMQPQTKETMKP